MAGRTKCYRMAAVLADDLRAGLKKEFKRDGIVTTQEAHLLLLVDDVCATTELVEQRVLVVQRVLGGGYVDRGIIAGVRNLLRECLRLARLQTRSHFQSEAESGLRELVG